MASATGCAAFMVTIFPLRSTRSAGWPKAAAQAKKRNARMDTSILIYRRVFYPSGP
jgi:hypothetical protein